MNSPQFVTTRIEAWDMATLAAGESITITLPAGSGQVLTVQRGGRGELVFGPGPQAGRSEEVGSSVLVHGPFTRGDATIYLTATSGVLTYTVATQTAAGIGAVQSIIGVLGLGSTLTAVLGVGWTVTGYQWSRTVAGVTTDIAGEIAATHICLPADLANGVTLGCRGVGSTYTAFAAMATSKTLLPLIAVGNRGGPQIESTTNNNGTLQADTLNNRVRITNSTGVAIASLVFDSANYAANGTSIAAGSQALTTALGFLPGGSSSSNPSGRSEAKYGGAASSALASDAIVHSDEFILPAVIPAGGVIDIWTNDVYVAPPTRLPVSGVRSAEAPPVDADEAGTGLADKHLTGTITGKQFARLIGSLISVRGRPAYAAPYKPGIMIYGDSILAGRDDALDSIYLGWAQRGFAANYPWSTSAQFGGIYGESGSVLDRRLAPIIAGSHGYVFCNLGTNNLGGTATDVQLIAFLNSLKATCAGLGAKLIPITIGPRTNATNDGPIPGDGVNVDTYRLSYNNTLRANNGCGDGFFDLAIRVQDAANQNRWRTDMFGLATTDGIHIQPAYQAWLATELANVAPVLFPMVSIA